MAFLACTTSSMIGTVPRMRFLLKRSNDITKVREIPSPTISKIALREQSTAQDVRLPYPRLKRRCQKNKKDIRLNNLGHGPFMDTLLRQSCQNNCTK